jgi:hypothetical protein
MDNFVTFVTITLLALLLFSPGCTNKPIVLPQGTTVCTNPYYGTDCLDAYGTFSTFKNGLPCNTCQTHDDYLLDKNGCAWASSPGAPNLWCTIDCNTCSAIIATFTKKN